MEIENKIKIYLKKLKPDFINIINNYHKHINHEGSKKGGHYELIIVSSVFENKTKMERHRIVNDILKNLFENGIHALNIIALTKKEWYKKQIKNYGEKNNE